jgi:hypothetical protein
MPLKYIFVSILLIFYAVLYSQELIREQTIRLSFTRNNFRLSSIPFKKVQVLDNPFDKSKFFIDQIGEYPITIFNFENTSKIIENYFDEAAREFSNRKDTLVLHIEEFNVPNRRVPIERKENKNIRTPLGSRHHIRLAAVCYYKDENNLYRKLVTIKKKYATYYPGLGIEIIIKELLNDIIQSAAIALNPATIPAKRLKRLKHLVNDSSSFRYESEQTFRTLEQINVPVEAKWKLFPILKNESVRHGNYRTFEDFRQDSLSNDPFTIKSTINDSLFKISPFSRPPTCICPARGDS